MISQLLCHTLSRTGITGNGDSKAETLYQLPLNLHIKSHCSTYAFINSFTERSSVPPARQVPVMTVSTVGRQASKELLVRRSTVLCAV